MGSKTKINELFLVVGFQISVTFPKIQNIVHILSSNNKFWTFILEEKSSRCWKTAQLFV